MILPHQQNNNSHKRQSHIEFFPFPTLDSASKIITKDDIVFGDMLTGSWRIFYRINLKEMGAFFTSKNPTPMIHECFLPKRRVKFFGDFEYTLQPGETQLPLTECMNVIGWFKEIVTKLAGGCKGDFLTLNASSSKKFSYHVVYTGVCVSSLQKIHQYILTMITKVKSAGNFYLLKWILNVVDLGVYREGRSLRTIFSSKWEGEKKVRILLPTVFNNRQPLELLLGSLITNTKNLPLCRISSMKTIQCLELEAGLRKPQSNRFNVPNHLRANLNNVKHERLTPQQQDMLQLLMKNQCFTIKVGRKKFNYDPCDARWQGSYYQRTNRGVRILIFMKTNYCPISKKDHNSKNGRMLELWVRKGEFKIKCAFHKECEGKVIKGTFNNDKLVNLF